MRRVILTVGMLLMGVGLVGGAAGTVLVTSFSSVDQQVGTHGSAAAAVLGVGLIIAAFNPAGSIGWVRAGILYGAVVLVFEVISWLHGAAFHLGPVIFGLAFSLLLIATYPERKKLLPTAVKKPAPALPAPAPAPEPEKAAEKPV
jgi:hypothetical protein